MSEKADDNYARASRIEWYTSALSELKKRGVLKKHVAEHLKLGAGSISKMQNGVRQIKAVDADRIQELLDGTNPDASVSTDNVTEELKVALACWALLEPFQEDARKRILEHLNVYIGAQLECQKDG